MDRDELKYVCEFFFGFGISLILQGIGLFAPNWVTTETCDAIGLFYRCCGKNDTGCVVDGADSYLNKAALGFQATSYTFMILAAISVVCLMQIDEDDNDKDYGCLYTCLSCNVVLLYPIGGLLSVIGCIALATEYSTSELSWGFYLSLTAGCYTILLIMFFCYVMMKCPKLLDIENKNNGRGTTVRTPDHSGTSDERPELVQVKGKVFLHRMQVFHISGSK